MCSGLFLFAPCFREFPQKRWSGYILRLPRQRPAVSISNNVTCRGTHSPHARRCAIPPDALFGWVLLRGEVSKQPTALASSGERVAGKCVGGTAWLAGARFCRGRCQFGIDSLNGRVGRADWRVTNAVRSGVAIWLAVPGRSGEYACIRLPARCAIAGGRESGRFSGHAGLRQMDLQHQRPPSNLFSRTRPLALPGGDDRSGFLL